MREEKDLRRRFQFVGNPVKTGDDGQPGVIQLGHDDADRASVGSGEVLPRESRGGPMFTTTDAFSGFSVDDLNSRGVLTKIYADDQQPSDSKGIERGNGPDIAWFRDPAGNVLSVVSSR